MFETEEKTLERVQNSEGKPAKKWTYADLLQVSRVVQDKNTASIESIGGIRRLSYYCVFENDVEALQIQTMDIQILTAAASLFLGTALPIFISLFWDCSALVTKLISGGFLVFLTVACGGYAGGKYYKTKKLWKKIKEQHHFAKLENLPSQYE